MPKIKATLTERDITIIEEVYITFGEIKCLRIFEDSFARLYQEKKLSLALEHIKYSPFINAINKGEYKFFIDLISALPNDTNKKLLLLYDDNEVIKKYIDSIVSNKENLGDIIWEVTTLLFSLLPETVIECSKKYIKNLYDENKINEEDRGNLLIVFNHSYEMVTKTTDKDAEKSDDETASTASLPSESDQDLEMVGETSQDNE